MQWKGRKNMPIKIQSDLPVKEILEKENIFVMDEKSSTPGYPSHSDFNFKSDALKRGDRAAAFAFSVKYTAAGGCFLYDGQQPYLEKYGNQSSE